VPQGDRQDSPDCLIAQDRRNLPEAVTSEPQDRLIAHRHNRASPSSMPATERHERMAADIPGFSLSRGGLEVRPGDGFVVGGVGFEASVEDVDEAVAELA
jgi:uncharacterized protein GlcG (DUF336 family)